jgi:uncharacterized protein (TIGR02646 family)
MEKINKRKLKNIPTLQKLHDNWEKWGQDYKTFLDSGSPKKQKDVKKVGQDFSWRENIYDELRIQIQIYDGASHRDAHCCFCDGYPIGENSKETIEHFYPKADFPLLAYDWDNLFYCCDKCQSEANRTPFTYTLKPSDSHYLFDSYFYFDLGSGEVKVVESLEKDFPDEYKKGEDFLKRYGINNVKRNKARQYLYYDVKHFLQNQSNTGDVRIRQDFKYRFVYDFAKEIV